MNSHTTIIIQLGYPYKFYQVVREDFQNVWMVLEYQKIFTSGNVFNIKIQNTTIGVLKYILKTRAKPAF